MHNPFETLSNRLSNLESLALQILARLNDEQAVLEAGGIELACEVTRLSKQRVYTLVAAGEIPCSKRGNRLHFNRAELLAWIGQGKRSGHTATNK